MTVHARIEAGRVAELIEISADGPVFEERYHPDIVATCVAVPAGVSVEEGWTWDGEAFAAPPPPEPVAPAVPASVTARQARLALRAAGLLGQFEAAVAAADGAVQIEWEYATTIERASPLLAAIAGPGGLDLTGAEIDALFMQAAGL